MIVIARCSNLESFIPTKYVVSYQVVTDKRKFGCIECTCLLVHTVESCCCQLVGAAANHLSSIPKKTFYCVSVHGPRANALALYHTVDVHDCNESQQQRFDAEPSFICKKNVFGGMLLLYPLVMQFLPSRNQASISRRLICH